MSRVKKALKEIGLRLLSIGLVTVFLIAVSIVGSHFTKKENVGIEEKHTIETIPPPTPTPTPDNSYHVIYYDVENAQTYEPKKPELRDRLDPKQIDHVYFFYADTPADREALEIVKKLTKYVNITFCKVIANGSTVDLPLRKEYMKCARALHLKFNDGDDPQWFATPSLVVLVKNFDSEEYENKYILEWSKEYVGHPNYVYDGEINKWGNYKNVSILYYWGVNDSYTTPDSIEWFYAQITGEFLKPPAYGNRTYHVYYKESENVTALVLGPNYIPEPITPLNPNDVKLIIYADSRGINDEYAIPVMDNYTKRIRELIPHAKFVSIIDWSVYYHHKKLISNPPGYEDYWDKYVVPYAKFYDPRLKDWFIDTPCIILIMKDGSHKTYAGVDTYEGYVKCIMTMGHEDDPYDTYPPIEKLFLDVRAYYEEKGNTTMVKKINEMIKEIRIAKKIASENS